MLFGQAYVSLHAYILTRYALLGIDISVLPESDEDAIESDDEHLLSGVAATARRKPRHQSKTHGEEAALWTKGLAAHEMRTDVHEVSPPVDAALISSAP